MPKTITIVRHAEVCHAGEHHHTLTDVGKEQTEHFARLAIECRTIFDLVIADSAGCSTGRHIIETMGQLLDQPPPPYTVIDGGGLMVSSVLTEHKERIKEHCLIIINDAGSIAKIASSFFGDTQIDDENTARLNTTVSLEHLDGYRFHLNPDGSIRVMKHVRWDGLIQLERLSTSASTAA